MPSYTKEQLLQFQREINHFYKMRKLFLGLGWALIGTAILIVFPIAVAIGINDGDYVLISYLISFMIVGGIVLFVLRKAMFNRRIKNRKQILKEAKEEHEIESMFEK